MPAPRFLIVEDERLVVNALVSNLEGLGYKVVRQLGYVLLPPWLFVDW